MVTALTEVPALQEFLQKYTEIRGGVWEEIEPQVYDILLPSESLSVGTSQNTKEQLVRIALDPEALQEHSGAQLFSYGTPLVDRLLQDAAQRGRFAQGFVNGLKLEPHDFLAQVDRRLQLAHHLKLRIHRVRPLSFPQAIFWFQLALFGDQTEHQSIGVAMDLHYARAVRHLDRLLDSSRLDDQPCMFLAEAPSIPLSQAYPLARERVVGTLGPWAAARHRELDHSVTRQINRMTGYFEDMRNELRQQQDGAEVRLEPHEQFKRQEAIDREERLRIAELKKKGTIRFRLKLTNLLLVQLPKLLAFGTLISPEHQVDFQLVWDPLMSALEAPPCPSCGRPSMTIHLNEDLFPVCPECPSPADAKDDEVADASGPILQ